MRLRRPNHLPSEVGAAIDAPSDRISWEQSPRLNVIDIVH